LGAGTSQDGDSPRFFFLFPASVLFFFFFFLVRFAAAATRKKKRKKKKASTKTQLLRKPGEIIMHVKYVYRYVALGEDELPGL